MMDKQEIINKTADYVKEEMQGESSGHDWWHVYRVWQIAKTLCATESGADEYVVELAALLHDLNDWKFSGPEAGPLAAKQWLEKCSVGQETTEAVVSIIRGEISQSGQALEQAKSRIEYKIVHDADNLDAIGAIGIARAFATGAKFKETFYDPSIPARKPENIAEYISTRGKEGCTVINHFYEKLLTIKGLMRTKEAKKLAEKRHKYMEDYLEQFYSEWQGKV